VREIVLAAGDKVVESDHVVTLSEQSISEVTPDEPRSTSDQDAHHDPPSYMRQPDEEHDRCIR
jgi:hypothetical protein